MRPGDIPLGIYFLKKGYVRLYSIFESGEELTLIIFKSNDFFPVAWAINNDPNEYYLEAMTDAELYRAPKDDLLKFLSLSPEVFFEFTSRMLYRMSGVLKRMEYLVFGNAYQKVASMILICASRFGEKNGNKLTIQLSLTHKDIANLLGITRETVSLEIKKLKEKGVVVYRGRYIIVEDINKLQKESLLTL